MTGLIRFISIMFMLVAIFFAIRDLPRTCAAPAVTSFDNAIFHAICGTDTECLDWCDDQDIDCDGGPAPAVQS